MASPFADQAARAPLGDLRPRRDPLAAARGLPAAALHVLPRHRRASARSRSITALTTVLVIVLRLGISSAFFRFYFDSKDAERRTLVVRTSFWFTMAMATVGLVLGCRRSPTPIAHCSTLGDDPWLVRAGSVGLWAQMNYAQLTTLFRVEERSVAVRDRERRERPDHRRRDGRCSSSVSHKGAIGAVVGNFLGTLAVYLVLLGYRRYQLGLAVRPRAAPRDEPLRAAARPVGARALGDQLHRPPLRQRATRARPRSASTRSPCDRVGVIVFLMIAFRLAWPAFAYSIDDDGDGEAHVLVRAHLPALHLLLDLARARRARAVDRQDPRAVEPELLPRRRGGRRSSRSPRPRTPATPCSRSGSAARADAVQLDRQRRRGRAEHRAQLRADPALRDDGRRRLDRSPPTSRSSSA